MLGGVNDTVSDVHGHDMRECRADDGVDSLHPLQCSKELLLLKFHFLSHVAAAWSGGTHLGNMNLKCSGLFIFSSKNLEF